MRRRANSRAARNNFRRTAVKTKKCNINPGNKRGGGRL